MKKILSILCLFSLVLFSCGGGDFEQMSYFKKQEGNQNKRFFLFKADPATPVAELEAHAGKQMYTDGGITWVAYHPLEAECPNIDNASGFEIAVERVKNYPSRPFAVYLRGINGKGQLLTDDPVNRL